MDTGLEAGYGQAELLRGLLLSQAFQFRQRYGLTLPLRQAVQQQRGAVRQFRTRIGWATLQRNVALTGVGSLLGILSKLIVSRR